MAGANTLRVLIVCAANQCRSRTAEIVLAHALEGHPHIHVTSAGVAVEAPLPLCPKAEKYLMAQGITPLDAPRPAQALTPALLKQADVVLVADKLVRAAVAAMDVSARSKTFSLRGAGSAAAYINANQLVARARAAHAQGAPEVTEIIDGESQLVCLALAPDAANRWLITELEAAQGHAVPSGGHDVEDAHVILRVRHSTVFEQIREACTALATLLRTLDVT